MTTKKFATLVVPNVYVRVSDIERDPPDHKKGHQFHTFFILAGLLCITAIDLLWYALVVTLILIIKSLAFICTLDIPLANNNSAAFHHQALHSPPFTFIVSFKSWFILALMIYQRMHHTLVFLQSSTFTPLPSSHKFNCQLFYVQ